MHGALTSPSDTSLQKQVTLLPGAFLPLSPPPPTALPGLCFLTPVALACIPSPILRSKVHLLVKQNGHHSVQLILVTFRRLVNLLNVCI